MNNYLSFLNQDPTAVFNNMKLNLLSRRAVTNDDGEVTGTGQNYYLLQIRIGM